MRHTLYSVPIRKRAAFLALTYLALEVALMFPAGDAGWGAALLLMLPWSIVVPIVLSLTPNWVLGEPLIGFAYYVAIPLTNPLLVYVIGGWMEELT